MIYLKIPNHNAHFEQYDLPKNPQTIVLILSNMTLLKNLQTIMLILSNMIQKSSNHNAHFEQYGFTENPQTILLKMSIMVENKKEVVRPLFITVTLPICLLNFLNRSAFLCP
jgi:hypothetical protein